MSESFLWSVNVFWCLIIMEFHTNVKFKLTDVYSLRFLRLFRWVNYDISTRFQCG